MLRIFQVLRALAFTLCLVAFSFNIWNTLLEFFSHKTTVFSGVQELNDQGMEMPSLTICSKSGYKTMGPRLNLSHFLDSTYSQEEVVLKMMIRGAIQDKPKPLYSQMRGRCYTYAIDRKMMSLEPASFHFPKGVDLIVYVHEPTEEFFFHYSYFPELITNIEIPKDITMVDFELVQERMDNKNGGCKLGWGLPAYIDCAKKLSIGIFNDIDKKVSNCTVPWDQSLLGHLEYEDHPCSKEEYETKKTYAVEFIKKVANFEFQECPLPCSYKMYQPRVEKYNNASTEVGQERIMYFYHTSDGITVQSREPIMGFNGMISALGGGLGLFLGFSAISALFYGIRKLEYWWDSHKSFGNTVKQM